MEEKNIVTDLPDESEYPKTLTDEYEIVERLSAGEGSETLLVKHKTNGTLCTAKCFTPDSPLFDHSEPDVLKHLDCPPLPKFMGEYRSERMRCTLHEYIPGETLKEKSRDRSFTSEEVVRIGSELCDQLALLHTQTPPIIHRDIKPENVIIREDGLAVLIDFGIARESSGEKSDPDTAAFGTKGFAPPEQYGFRQTNARSDIYSLGILMNWMIRGDTKLPEQPETALDRVISKCTAFDPDNRYGSAKDLKSALNETYAHISGSGLNKKETNSPSSKGGWILAAILTCLVIGAAIYFMQGGRSSKIQFKEPLIEEAVRQNLGISQEEPITKKMLADVSGLYIVSDEAYPVSDDFYSGINRWYAEENRRHGSIATLEDVSMLPNLKELCVAAQEIEDLSPAAGLPNLEKIEVKHNRIKDISVLSGMDRLTSVGINDNPVTDISPLEDCPELKFLDLCDVKEYDASVIGKLGNFTFLDLSNPTESYRYLNGKEIGYLRLAWTGLSDLNDLTDVDGLIELDISHTNAADLSPLASHKELRQLNIAEIPAEDLSVLLSLPSLERVTVSESMRPLAEALGDTPFEIQYGS